MLYRPLPKVWNRFNHKLNLNCFSRNPSGRILLQGCLALTFIRPNTVRVPPSYFQESSERILIIGTNTTSRINRALQCFHSSVGKPLNKWYYCWFLTNFNNSQNIIFKTCLTCSRRWIFAVFRPVGCLVPIHSGKEVMSWGTNVLFVIFVRFLDRAAVR